MTAEDPSLTFTIGKEELVVRRRYESASIVNDFIVAAWFLVGSVLLLFPSLAEAGTWCFVLGSVQFLARPGIRLAHRLHLQRIPQSTWES